MLVINDCLNFILIPFIVNRHHDEHKGQEEGYQIHVQ